MIFSQSEINEFVSLDMLLTFGGGVALAAYVIYKWIDYKIFLHKSHNETENKPWP